MREPGMSFAEASKAAGEAWKAVSAEERAPWQRLADEAKQRYVRELADYTKEHDAQN